MFWNEPKSRRFAVPDGDRIYAIGDVHGRLDLLEPLLERIAEDDARRGPARTHLVFLGDLIDRGPDSAGVVELVRHFVTNLPDARLIQGNHEEVFVLAARGDAKAARMLLSIGGYATLESYGISRAEADQGNFADLAVLMASRIPREHIDFLASAEPMVVYGDHVFVHAGIRPGQPLTRQSGSDLRWIREPFLSARRRDGVLVVHGHTPRAGVEDLEDRINLDTGAFATGILSAAGFDGDGHWFLEARDPVAQNVAA